MKSIKFHLSISLLQIEIKFVGKKHFEIYETYSFIVSTYTSCNRLLYTALACGPLDCSPVIDESADPFVSALNCTLAENSGRVSCFYFVASATALIHLSSSLLLGLSSDSA